MKTIPTLKSIIHSGNDRYPFYIGSYPAEDIHDVASAPSFDESTKNREIADNILSYPIEDWQRPLDEGRLKDISRLFDNTGEFMPNPILLSENFNNDENVISVEKKVAKEGVLTEIYNIEIDEDTKGNEDPLWILDGQHRISGLNRSDQSSNPVPFVLLLNTGGSYYTGADMAKIFAQVTTSAEKLNSLHNEWLTYAFNLGDYSKDNPEHKLEEKSMETVANLCKSPELGSGGPNNPFHDDVGFSPKRNVEPDSGGFKYDCKYLKDLILKYYYKSSTQNGKLPPRELSKQIGLSYLALTKVVSTPQKSVFFGKENYDQTIMQDAFIVGVLNFLVHNGTPSDWQDVLEDLNFDDTPWNFQSWISGLGGRAATTSKNIARNVFSETFRNRSLPENTSNLADYLRGDGAWIELEFSFLTDAGQASTVDRESFRLSAGSRTSTSVDARRHISISERSTNIGKVEVLDRTLTDRGMPIQYDIHQKSGYMVLNKNDHKNPLQLLINFHHYGDNRNDAEIDIKWKEK